MQELGNRLTISDINTGDAELLEESKDFSGRLMRNRPVRVSGNTPTQIVGLVVWRFPSSMGLMGGMSS